MSHKLKTLIFGLMLLSPLPVMMSGLQVGIAQGGPSPLTSAPDADIFTNSGQGLGGETGNGVALGDLDGDGDVDAFVANDFGLDGANQVWLNNGEGNFSSGQTLGTTNGTAVALGDLDADGDLDTVVTTNTNVSAIVWLNQGGLQGGTEGEFAEGESLGSFSGYGVATGDIDNDGDRDVMVVGNINQVWLNNGNATFAAGPALPLQFSEAVVLADLDEDSYLDAVIVDSAVGSSNRVWWNDGNWEPGPGSFTAGDLLPTTGLIQGAAMGNLDEDERQDIFLVGLGADQIYWNEGEREFITNGPLPVSDSSWGVALDDVDGDGLGDAVVANTYADPNRVWHNEGGRAFTVTQEFGDESGLYWSRGVGLANLNGDGSPDLFEVTTAEDRVWFNTAAPPIVPNEEGWQIQALDTRGYTGILPSLVVDANGFPHIAYVSSTVVEYDDEFAEYVFDYQLRYTGWDGVRWHTENVVTGYSTIRPIRDLSIALDADGKPHIAYVHELDFANFSLRHAYWDGVRWHDDVVSGIEDNIENITYAIDTNGNSHIIYQDDRDYIKYAYSDGTTWNVETIDDVSQSDRAVSLALDTYGNPHVSYLALYEVLTYAHRDEEGWHKEIIVETSAIGLLLTSLALDKQGNPHIAYSDEIDFDDGLLYTYWDGEAWQFQTVDSEDTLSVQSISLTLDSANNPHFFYTTLNEVSGLVFKYAHWEATGWLKENLDYSTSVNPGYEFAASMVLDADDKLHASYYEPTYGDLRYISWDANWQTRTLPETGVISRTAIDVETTIPSIAYYSQSGGQVKTTQWNGTWEVDSLDFIGEPVTNLALDAGINREHVSYYDADNQRLMFQYRDFDGWHIEVVDEAGDVGRYNDLLFVNNPHIAYWDATSQRMKLAVAAPGTLLWNIYPNFTGPSLNADSGMLSAAVFPGGDVGVTYYDGLNDDLRLAVWDEETGEWSDELVDGADGDVGRVNSLQFDSTEGTPVVAYLEQEAIRIAYKVGNLWETQDVPGTDGGVVISLSLELGLNSRLHARIAYRTSAGTLNVVSLRDGVWQTEQVASLEASPTGDISTSRDVRLHLAYGTGSGLEYAFRTATLEADTSGTSLPPAFGDGYYNPLDACQALLDIFTGDGNLNHSSSSNQIAVLPADPTHLDDDHRIFNAMTDLFNASAGGQAYVDLYRRYGAEMARLGLQDPGLLWDAFGTLQNFIPGIKALVTGGGEKVIVTQGMVEDALDVWQRLAANASPELAAVINTELAKYDNLQDFAGMSFNDWARAIGVEPPAEVLFMPVIVKNH